MPCDHGGADCWREQHRHSLGLTLVPRRNQPLGIFKDLRIGRAPSGRFFVGLIF
jgi:hypothetical protein